ncbi:GspE/PulE family protein [Fusobacterium russii]|uniref:GspE/PulE family protein n=1 Tax=Fusobacterium russii TaxID=854 RepID=UPI0003A8CBDD|nr:GspE/PulE family protein [Fusobacterium russii]
MKNLFPEKFENFFKLYEDNETSFFNAPGNDLEQLFENENSKPIKGLFFLLKRAVDSKASDIHFENLTNYLKVRFRINGLLKEIVKIEKNLSSPIISKLKILSSLDIVEKRKPQDGRFSLIYKNREIDFRISVIPTINGEKAVIRILDRFSNDFSLNDLYLSEKNKKLFYNAINQNNGIILFNGPTGSGKSTTLYSILKYKNSELLNISTVEDPVEYQIDGLNQIQCKNDIGLNFAYILRALLRQDPDVIMIGEIRDKETAEIAVKASLTGHLVFSTIHSNDTLGSINRLINLGIDSYLLSLVLVMSVSQRLLRKLCPNCKIIDENYVEKLVSLNYDLNSLDDSTNLYFYTHSEKGCENCMNTGYIGRIPIFEILYFDEKAKEILLKNHNKLSTSIIQESLLEDAISKAKSGLTSLDEILRQL